MTTSVPSAASRHVFACLVHEKPEVVADLVRNLRALEPDASILLYDGSASGHLLDDARVPRHSSISVHPAPRPMRWGRLHDFAIDAMRFALTELDFTALTIVDSDQLLLRGGYTQLVTRFLAEHPDAGMLGNAPDPQPRTSRVDPVKVAWREPDLWRPLLARLPGGFRSFPHWTFWPSTIFTRAAAVDLVRMFDDPELLAILDRSRIWATEEVVIPTLVAALGHGIARSPASFDYVRYRVAYSAADVERAMRRSDVYWMHPVPRIEDHPLRERIRRQVTDRAPSEGEASPGLTMPTEVPPGRREKLDLGRLGRGLDRASVALLDDACRSLAATARPRRIVAPDPTSPVGAVVRELLGAYGVDDPPIPQEGVTAEVSNFGIDLAVSSDPVGLVAVADNAARIAACLRPGGSLVFVSTSAHAPDVAAVMRTLAAARPGSVVTDVGRSVRMRVPDSPAHPLVPAVQPPRIRRLVEQTLGVEGWLEPDEAALLAVVASAAIAATGGEAIVELGSFCGRATVVLGGVARWLVPQPRVHAIDRFDGVVGEIGGALYECGPTLDRFRAAVSAAGLERSVDAIVSPPAEVQWRTPIGLLLVDSLHDYASVAADFHNFEGRLHPAGFVAFHDYAPYYPGVRRFVDELIAGNHYHEVARIRSLIVLRTVGAGDRRSAAAHPSAPESIDAQAATLVTDVHTRREGATGGSPSPPMALTWSPLVSCIMPTYDRRAYVPSAIARFLAQDYPNRELIVVDDGSDAIDDLVPSDDRIRYVRIAKRMTIGAKRNLACEIAGGEVLAHWDDDDWVASWRLRYEVEALLSMDADIVGLSTLLYYDPSTAQAWRYHYTSTHRPWVHDPTFCYRRRVWEAERFPDTNFGLDIRYLQGGRRKDVRVLSDHRFYVGIIHPGNTSQKLTRGANWRSTSVDDIRELMARDELPEVERAESGVPPSPVAV